MAATTRLVPLNSCPTCLATQSTHPGDGCTCQHGMCQERALYDVRRHSRATIRPRCERHLRYEIAAAERWGYALVIMALVPYAGPTLPY